MGTPAAAAVSLERLIADGHEIVAVYTQPDRPAGRGNRLKASPVKELGVERGIPVLQPLQLRTDEAAEIFRSHAADVAVVVAYGRILPKAFLEAFPWGAINVHFSLLPKYRGAAPVNWAIVNNETFTGVTTMKMDEGLDTGDILLQRETAIETEENAVELMERLGVTGADLLAETLFKLEELVPMPQDHEKATHAPIMKKADGVIDWERAADEIAARVRGFQPFPTAYTSFRGKRLTIWKATSTAAFGSYMPAEISSATGDELVIRCGGGTAIRCFEVQLEGRSRVSAQDFINGARPAIGERLG